MKRTVCASQTFFFIGYHRTILFQLLKRTSIILNIFLFSPMSSSLLTGFCGYSFWTNFSYHNKSDLSSHSQCLEHILLIWTPTLFVCLMAPFFAFQILLMHRKRSFDPLPWQRLIAFKLVLTLLAILGRFLSALLYPI
jgi:hypothetical protein